MQQIIYPAATVRSGQHTVGRLPGRINFDTLIGTFPCVTGHQHLLQQLPYRHRATSQAILDRQPPPAFPLHRASLYGTIAAGNF